MTYEEAKLTAFENLRVLACPVCYRRVMVAGTHDIACPSGCGRFQWEGHETWQTWVFRNGGFLMGWTGPESYEPK